MRVSVNQEKKDYYFGIAIVLLPILFQYSVGISTITLGDLFLALCFMLHINLYNTKINVRLIALIVFVIFQSVILFACGNYTHISTTARYVFYLIVIHSISTTCFNRNRIVVFFVNTNAIVSVLILIQTLLYRMFGFVLPGVFTFLPLTDSSLYNYSNALMYTNSSRCMSVFGEPSHFAIYVLPCIMMLLIDKNCYNGKGKLWKLLVMILGVLVSSSFSGFLGLVTVIGIWMIYNFNSRRIKVGFFIYLAVIIVAAVVFLSRSAFLTNYLFNGRVYERQAAGRFIGFSYILNTNFNMLNRLFGHGMTDVGSTVYLSGWPRLYYYYGIVGALLFIFCILPIKGNKKSWAILIVVAVLSIGTEMIFSSFFVVYMLICRIECLEDSENEESDNDLYSVSTYECS